jgi:choline dehydrogenase-like flavoprotein
MLSGIGPKEHLRDLGIPLKLDLPVGQNMQSHIGISETIFIVDDPITFQPFFEAANPINVYKYLTRGTGVLSYPSGFENMGYLRTGRHNETWPGTKGCKKVIFRNGVLPRLPYLE